MSNREFDIKKRLIGSFNLTDAEVCFNNYKIGHRAHLQVREESLSRAQIDLLNKIADEFLTAYSIQSSGHSILILIIL